MGWRIGLAMLAALVAAQPVGAESLVDALAVAYRTNPTIRAERARLRATEQLKAQAWAGVMPQVFAEGSYSSLESTQTRSAIFGPSTPVTTQLNPLTGAVSAEQPIFNGLRNINAIRQARARVRAGGAELVGVEQQILQSVATAYFNVVRDMTIYDSNVNNLEVLRRQKQEAEMRFEVGDVTKTDVAQADARLARARAGLASAQAQLAVSRVLYAELVGEMPGALEPSPALPELPDSLEGAKAIAREFSPVVISAREQENVAERQVAISKGAFSPTISATASYQYSEEPSTFISSDESFAYGVRAQVPIFLGGLNLSRVREARALRDSARASVDGAERRAEAAVTSAWELLVSSRTTIEAAAAQVEANQLALTGVRRESQLGTRSTLDVLDAEQEFLNAKVSLANAERDQRVAAFSLLAAAGILNLDAIGIDPEAILPAESD